MQLSVWIQRAGYRKKTVLSDLRFTVEAGEFISVIGQNGAGKSTLLSAIASLIPYEGEVLADGVPLLSLSPRERARRISLLPQAPRAPHVTVEELLRFGLYPDLRPLHTPDAQQNERVRRALVDTELLSLRDAPVDRISGGERLRAYLGAVLVQNTPILLLDEPTSALDAAHGHRFLSLVRRLAREHGKTVIAATHDLSSAFYFSDRILLLEEGSPAVLLPTDELLREGHVARVFGVDYCTVERDGSPFPLFFVPTDGAP